jgi:hypothetical protein
MRCKNVKETIELLTYKHKFKLRDLIKTGNDDTIYLSCIGVYILIGIDYPNKNTEEFQSYIDHHFFSPVCDISQNVKTNSLKLDTSSCKSFYDDNNISDYYTKNVCYLAAIGLYNGYIIIKYGKSGRMFKRDYEEHRKTFGSQFKCVYIIETDNSYQIETLFEQNIKLKNLSVEMIFNGKKRKELFMTCDTFTLENAKKLLSDLVEKNPLLSVEIERVKRLDLELQIKKTEVDLLSNKNNIIQTAKKIIDDKIEKLSANSDSLITLKNVELEIKKIELEIKKTEFNLLSNENNIIQSAKKIIDDKIEKISVNSDSLITLKNVELELKKIELEILKEYNKKFIDKDVCYDLVYYSSMGIDYLDDTMYLIKKLSEYDHSKLSRDIDNIRKNLLSKHKAFMEKNWSYWKNYIKCYYQ